MSSSLPISAPSRQPLANHHDLGIGSSRLQPQASSASSRYTAHHTMQSHPTQRRSKSRVTATRAEPVTSMHSILNAQAALIQESDARLAFKNPTVSSATSCHSPTKTSAAKSAAPIAAGSRDAFHDAQPTPALDLVNVVSTPRKGRRLGRINMGWESPLTHQDRPALSCPHTLPQATRTRKAPYFDGELLETPTKRKTSTSFTRDPQRPQRMLVDNHGWASAAMISTVPLPEAVATPAFSPRAAPTLTPRPWSTSDVRPDAKTWTQFCSPVAPSPRRLVPLEVAGLGRVAVHREFAHQIAEQGPLSGPSSGLRRQHSFCSDYVSGLSSDTSCTGSSLGALTNPTSVGTPCLGGVSPSFPLSSRFPPLESESPLETAAAFDTQKAPQPLIPGGHDHAGGSSAKATSKSVLSLPVNAHWKPKLGGNLHNAQQTSLPSLEWPDDPSGPWAAAGQHMDRLKQQRRQGVQKWLETDLDDESAGSGSENAGSNHRHHPMVAKALLDRARKQKLSESASRKASSSPKKRSRQPKPSASIGASWSTPSRRSRKKTHAETDTTDTPSSRRSIAIVASLVRSDRSAIRGCKCGIEDDSIVMVQCDHCHRWLHLPCVGIANVDDLDEEWYCDDCCERVVSEQFSLASPLRTTVTSLGNFSTPGDLAAAMHTSEPVFALPSGTPVHRRGASLSSSIALAPSPPMLSIGQQPQPTSSSKQQGAGRARAERVGWRMNEPGSPLARKSTTASGSARHVGPQTPSRSSGAMQELADVATTPSLLAGFSRSDWEPTRSRTGGRPTTPSHRLAGPSTPSRFASGRKSSNAGGAFSIGLSEDEHPHAVDVFSTPSRLMTSGSWGLHSYPGSQTPSRSLRGDHHRIDSFGGGFSTPGRDLLVAGAYGAEPSTAHSGVASTLAFSGSSLDGLDDHFGEGSYALSRSWQLSSPTSSTRAARARQVSGFGTPSSSSLLRTPELQPQRLSTLSVRGSGRYDLDDPPTSSSPFPRTPTFDNGSPRYGGPERGRHQALGLGLPPPTSTSRLSKAASGSAATAATATSALSSSFNANSVEVKDKAGAGALLASTVKNRQVSSEMPFGLGIGLDLDDVLDWS
ncbi:hypothetical protein ACQY0O_001994 [Thecaphora frezii]